MSSSFLSVMGKSTGDVSKKKAANVAEKDLHTHISNVMSHVVRHQPANAVLDNLEEVSVLLKKTKDDKKFDMGQFTKVAVHKEYAKPGCAAFKAASEGLIASTKDKGMFAVSNEFIVYILIATKNSQG